MSDEPQEKKERSLITEVGVFGTGMGIMLGVAAYFLLTGLKGAQPVGGISRAVFFGVPVALLAVANLATGIMTLKTRSSGAIGGAIASGIAVAATYLVFEILFLGYPFAGRLLSLVIYLVPVMLVIRGFKALDEARAEQSKRAAAERAAKRGAAAAEE